MDPVRLVALETISAQLLPLAAKVVLVEHILQPTVLPCALHVLLDTFPISLGRPLVILVMQGLMLVHREQVHALLA
jgi:hypothetical protein